MLAMSYKELFILSPMRNKTSITEIWPINDKSTKINKPIEKKSKPTKNKKFNLESTMENIASNSIEIVAQFKMEQIIQFFLKNLNHGFTKCGIAIK